MVSRRRTLGFLAATSLISTRTLAQIATKRVDIRSSLAKRFDEDGTAGVFAAYETGGDSVVTSDGDRYRQAILPASTFKIPNSIIALETGIVKCALTSVLGDYATESGWSNLMPKALCSAASQRPDRVARRRDRQPTRDAALGQPIWPPKRRPSGAVERRRGVRSTGVVACGACAQCRLRSRIRYGICPADLGDYLESGHLVLRPARLELPYLDRLHHGRRTGKCWPSATPMTPR